MQGGYLELNDMTAKISMPDGTSNYNYGIRVAAYNTAANNSSGYNDAKAVISNTKTVEVDNPAVSDDNTYGDVGIVVVGANDKDDSAGIYHPQAGEMNIPGGSVTGKTGIEVRGGTVVISENPVITGTNNITDKYRSAYR